MKKAHFMLQGKGGIGKSFASVAFTQWLQNQGKENLLFLDLDQENPTFSQFKGIDAIAVNVMAEGRNIDARKFDQAMMQTFENKGDVYVDTGANTFSPLLAYVIENGIFSMLIESGITPIIHSVIGGGDTFFDTLTGFHDLATNLPDIGMIVWKNQHFGDLVTPDGKALEATKAWDKAKGQVIGEVALTRRTPATFGKDISDLLSLRLTLAEARQSGKFNFIALNRLSAIYSDIFSQLDKIEALK